MVRNCLHAMPPLSPPQATNSTRQGSATPAEAEHAGSVVPSTDAMLVATLGLDRLTLSRLSRAGIGTVAEMHACSSGHLWRVVGRHGIANLLARLAAHGLPGLALTDYERWRLGLLNRTDVHVRPGPETPLSTLWSALGVSVIAVLRDGGIETVRDLAPRTESDVRQLYRLGRSTLRTVESLLRSARESAMSDDRRMFDAGLKLIATCDSGRTRTHTPDRHHPRTRSPEEDTEARHADPR